MKDYLQQPIDTTPTGEEQEKALQRKHRAAKFDAKVRSIGYILPDGTRVFDPDLMRAPKQ